MLLHFQPLPHGRIRTQLASLILEQLLQHDRSNGVEQWLKGSSQFLPFKTYGMVKSDTPDV